MFCREHATQLREHYEEITAAGAEVVAVGTGDLRYAEAFVRDEKIPFPVLVDDDGVACAAAALNKGGGATLLRLVSPRVVTAGIRAHKAGIRQHRVGARPLQLGATFVVGPGRRILYQHVDTDVADHAPLDEVLAAVTSTR